MQAIGTLLRKVNAICPVAAKIKVIEYKRTVAFLTHKYNGIARTYNQ